ncbi:Endoglucanase precursor [Nocardioides dokdonensis FR1436]|uniref:Endoglucanase n=1 Tax=Nocardioides dokdonensis FR1436 TaxID=1300347 RepID=A0A1A9GI29_9ACTN|nr:cellulase family glycosylhydrolase [Nocardioides dokdonensis]ANH37161.1 Endoglucanase precursor [Nocardioides dokdonensis FR1436]
MHRPTLRVVRRAGAAVALLVAAAAAAVVLPGVLADDEAATGAAPQPVVEGNRLVDQRTGRTWVPRGVNWSSMEYACAQGWGLSSLDAGGTDPMGTQAAAIASWGADTVRLPLNQDCWLGTRGAPVSDEYTERTPADYRAQVADFVDALNAHGLVVVLDLHSRKRIGVPEFGNLAMPDAESLAFWRSVAQEYADHPSVMFDAFNEPYSRYDAADRLVFDLTWECWRDGGCAAPAEDDRSATTGRTTYAAQGMQAVVDAIRDAGAEQPVLLSGLDYANDLSRWQEFRPDDDQLVAAFHSYDFKECGTRVCWDEVLAPLARTVPVLTSELGATDPLDGYVDDYLAWADDHGVGALFWVWADHAGDPMSLVRDRLGSPTAWGLLAQSWLGGEPSAASSD